MKNLYDEFDVILDPPQFFFFFFPSGRSSSFIPFDFIRLHTPNFRAYPPLYDTQYLILSFQFLEYHSICAYL